jgi:signal transduction histidine kinase/ActR/RegA family two-component response regulator
VSLSVLAVAASVLAAATILLLVHRVRLRAAIRVADARLQMALAAAPVALWSVDPQGAVTFAAGTRIDGLHFTPDDLRGRQLGELWADVPVLQDAHRQALAGSTDTRRIESEHGIFDVACAPLLDARGRLIGALGTAVDVTERESLDEQLRQAQKMEAIGRFTGGIAHDFNNVLTAILGYSDMTLAQIGPDKPIWKDLRDIHQAATRAASLTRQLLAFSRKQRLKLGPVDLNAIARDIDKLLRRLIGEDVTLRLDLADDIGAITADAGQLEQVIMNLAVNARDAMSGGGTLTVTTSRTQLADSYVNEHKSVLPGPYVQLTVTDTGCGMDARTQARIFEPFFTTKESGKGTGLGLATVYSIVKQFGGYIFVYSEAGHGTTFKIYFPEIDVAALAGASGEDVRLMPSGTENVLLVEDEDSVRAFTAAVLKRYGYHVLEASAPAEALLLADCVSGSIHLVLTDVIMPGMTGPAMADRLRLRHPEAAIVFMSGYPEHVVREGILDAKAPFLEKPFTSTALLKLVREKLDERNAIAGVGALGAGACVWTT